MLAEMRWAALGKPMRRFCMSRRGERPERQALTYEQLPSSNT
jgi:hypothetical protein